jgi:hypothetical protein
MKKHLILIITLVILSCKNVPHEFELRSISEVQIETIIADSLLNVRAIDIIEDIDGLFFATSNSQLGIIDKNSIIFPIPVSDSITPNFRAVASVKNGFALSIESPALIFKMQNDLKEIVYIENHPKAFYDSMDFWNDLEGLAIGDPTEECMSIIITRDGGNNWTKLSCDILPKTEDGEAAFAASDTNIAIVGDHTWIATGGRASRVLYSSDKGISWTVYNTPIIQGEETTGMYSIDFYDEFNGFAIGGDYTKPDDSQANKIRTSDGGKTWQVVGAGVEPGYRSCVQYVPNRQGEELVVVGFNGIDYSNDSGKSWKHLSDEGFYTIRFLNDSIAFAAGKGRISKLTFKE